MKATKFVILGGAVIALLSFFLPLVTAHVEAEGGKGVTVSISSFQIVKGLSSIDDVISGEAPNAHSAEAKQAVHDLQDVIKSVKTVILVAYAPAALLFLVGLVGSIRGKLGRLGGLGALLFGLIAAAIGAIMLSAASSTGDSGAGAGMGLYAMLLGGVVGLLGGLVTIVKPDRGANW